VRIVVALALTAIIGGAPDVGQKPGAAGAVRDAVGDALPDHHRLAGGSCAHCPGGVRGDALGGRFDYPRWLLVLPDSGVVVAEARTRMKADKDPEVVRQQVASKAMGRSADRIPRLRDADGDGSAEQRDVFLENLNQPFGMALFDGRLYVGTTDAVTHYPYPERLLGHSALSRVGISGEQRVQNTR
jgi:glucose/arabinose dehydrogenase